MKTIEENLREFIFGVEDGLIGNLGVVIGLATANAPNNLILLAGLATMFAQSISMSAGNYLSIKSEKEYFEVNKKDRKYGKKYAQKKQVLKQHTGDGKLRVHRCSDPSEHLPIFP